MSCKTIPFLIFFLHVFSISFSQNAGLRKLESSLSLKTDTSRVNTLNKLAWSYRRQNTQRSLDYAYQAQQLSKQLKYWPGLAYSWKNLGNAYYVKSDYPQAQLCLDKALQHFSELNNVAEIGNIYNSIGLLHWEQGRYDQAISSYNKAYARYGSINDQDGQAVVLGNLGIIYYELDQFDKALANYSKALTISEKLRNDLACANTHTNIALVYQQLENYEKSLFHLHASLQIEQRMNNLSGQATTFTDLASVYYDMDQLNKSLYYSQKAMPLYKKLGEQKGIGEALLMLGMIYTSKNEFETANSYFLEALSTKRRIGDKVGELSVLNNLGNLSLRQNRTQEAISILNEAYTLAGAMKSLKNQTISSFMLAEAYEKLNDQEEAMRFYKIYVASNDSLMRQKASHKLTNIQVGFETRKKQAEISALKTKAIVNSRKKAMAVTGGIAIMLIALIWFARQRRKHRKETLGISEKLVKETSRQKTLAKEKALLESELEAHRKSLLDYTQSLIARNEELEELKEQLNSSSANESNSSRIEELNALSLSRIVTDDDWEEFKVRYNKVFPYFMFRMKESHPSITPAELRLAALIRLKLTSREIASILGISADSVKKARQRLRKKLDLEAEADLENELMKFND